MQIVNNKKNSTFEAELPGGEKATLQYRWLKGSMVLMHTVVPKELRGKRIGESLVIHVLNHVRSHGLKVIVYCPFVTLYMEKHPEYNDLLDSGHSR